MNRHPMESPANYVSPSQSTGRGANAKRLPGLLVIGAMKSGTTGLYIDLASHPQFFLGHDKEPHSLCRDEVLTADGVRRYAAIYEKANPDQLCCDASTGYSKRPDFEGVVARALQVLPREFKVVYVVRDPIERIISQHHHEYFANQAGQSIDDEVRRHARFVQYSRYAYQLEPWMDALGPDRIRVVRFEDYVARRQETVRDLCGFLGLSANECEIEDEKVHNKSLGKPVKNRFWSAIQHNAAYRKLVRPLMSPKARLAVRGALFRKAPDQLPPPRPDTIEYLREALSDDVARLQKMLGAQAPMWSGYAGTTGQS